MGVRDKMSNLTIKQIEEIASTSKYIRGEFTSKLYGDLEGEVTFDKMMEFLSNEDNRYIMREMLKLAEDIGGGRDC